MMQDDTLRNIEYLREKADVSYEEAMELLTKFDGNVMRALVELERQGRVYSARPVDDDGLPPHYTHADHQRYQQDRQKEKAQEAKKKASGFVSRALEHRLVVESGAGDDKKTVANLSAPYVAGAAVIAPHLAVASVGLMFLLGYRVKLKKTKAGPLPEDVESFVDNTVSNIKQTASSFKETANTFKENVKNDKPYNKDDDDDEGGEITIE